MENQNVTESITKRKSMTERIIRMIDKKGFCEVFWETVQSQKYTTYEAAYEAVESEYKSVMGRRRYKNFQSFKRRRDE